MTTVDELRKKMNWVSPDKDSALVKTCGAIGKGDLWMALVYQKGGLYFAAAAPFGQGDAVQSPVPRTSMEIAVDEALEIAALAAEG